MRCCTGSRAETLKLRVRMYRQGLGDCFLLTCSDGNSESHLLIDCGVLKGTGDAEKRMQDVAQSVHDTTNGKLDLLVVTHEHWDHLSGFLQAGAIFDTFEVGEVWLAWTEDPQDELANELRKRKEKRLNGIVAAAKLADRNDTPAARRTAAQLESLLNFHGDLGVAGTKTTGKALEWVKARQAPVKYLRPGDQLFDLAGLPGIRLYVLGPPHDSRLIKRSDPSKKHPEVYELAAAEGLDIRGSLPQPKLSLRIRSRAAQPFDEFFRVDESEARNENELWKKYYAKGRSWRRVDDDWLGYAGAARAPARLGYEQHQPRARLRALERRRRAPLPRRRAGRKLALVGIARVADSGRSRTRTVKSDDLLARTVLYKVGHHGSHNATLREKGLELMASSELAAMIPVNRVTAKKMDWLMPFPALLTRLVEKTHGRVMDAERGLDDAAAQDLSDADWARFFARTDVQPGWVDYTLEW